MQLSGPNLSLRSTSDDVKLLQAELEHLGYSISAEEVQAKTFGPSTHQAVIQFQKQHGLLDSNNMPTGIVDAETAKAINAAVDALNSPPNPEPTPDTGQELFTVSGQVLIDDKPRKGVEMRVFDKDVRDEEELGQASTDSDGRYEISYTRDKFTRAEKDNADLLTVS